MRNSPALALFWKYNMRIKKDPAHVARSTRPALGFTIITIFFIIAILDFIFFFITIIITDPQIRRHTARAHGGSVGARSLRNARTRCLKRSDPQHRRRDFPSGHQRTELRPDTNSLPR